MRHLNQNARTIARIGFTTTRTAVFHPLEHRKRIANNLMGFVTLHICYKAYATGVVFEGGMVKTLK